jgi:hypothetical protein
MSLNLQRIPEGFVIIIHNPKRTKQFMANLQAKSLNTKIVTNGRKFRERERERERDSHTIHYHNVEQFRFAIIVVQNRVLLGLRNFIPGWAGS